MGSTMYNLQGTVMLLALNYVVLCPLFFVLIFALHANLPSPLGELEGALADEVDLCQLLAHDFRGVEADALLPHSTASSVCPFVLDFRMDGEIERAEVAELHRVAVADEFSYLNEEGTIDCCNLLDADARVVGSVLDQRLVVNRSRTVEGCQIASPLVESAEDFIDLDSYFWLVHS